MWVLGSVVFWFVRGLVQVQSNMVETLTVLFFVLRFVLFSQGHFQAIVEAPNFIFSLKLKFESYIFAYKHHIVVFF